MRLLLAILLCASTALAQANPAQANPAQQHPRDAQIHDHDTKAWWHTTEALSNDSMEGRDTGSAAYQRAADYVGTWFQTVPMHHARV